MKPVWMSVASSVGLDIDPNQMTLMEEYGVWLTTEGRRAGGIGPAETARIEDRHLADSLLFVSQMSVPPARVWDLGSGVGLPGIPLSICMPETEFLLIDRSQRRVDLMNRVIRILDLGNCQVLQSDIRDLSGEVECVVSRASLPPDDMGEVVKELITPGGVAILAGSWRQRPRFRGWATIEIPPDALDHIVWLLIMRRE